MAELAIDVGSEEQRARYPKHGWAENSQGTRLLWFPFKRLLWNAGSVRKTRGVGRDKPFNPRPRRDPFVETLRKYVIALRELHRVIRVACDYPLDFKSQRTDQDAENARSAARELSPVLTDVSIIYLRRLAERIVFCASPILFEFYKSAPSEYKTFVEKVNCDDLSSLNPICDVGELKKAIDEHSGWFDKVHTKHGAEIKGVRDAFEHRFVLMHTGVSQVGENRPTYGIQTQSWASDVAPIRDVLAFISACNADFCGLMDGLCKAAGWTGTYEWDDWWIIVGNDEDITGFWPEV